MSIGLYDISVASYLQTLGGVAGFLGKGRKHCEENGSDPNDLVEVRLYSDMLPLRFQVVSACHHSLGTVRALEAGVFNPPSGGEDLDYAGLEQLVVDTRAGLEGYSREAVDALEGRDLVFRLGERELPFTTEGFVLSFSLPNFYFHATTAYDILRMKGVPLGKRDFMGQMRMKG